MNLLWDQHASLPLRADAEVEPLTRFTRPGPTFVSVNAGYSPHSFADATRLLEHYRSAIAAHLQLGLADIARQIPTTPAATVAIAFDLEDAAPLDGDLDNLARFAALGVRTLAPTYNHANLAGGGCLDADDPALTRWGRDLVAQMNAVGVVPDGSHGSARTGLDMCEISTRPIVYSHSCMRSVWEHPRNITDDQARACAETGGVVGITGVGIFLGPNTPTLEAMTRHLEYAVDLIGIDHVGVSTDHSFDAADFLLEIARNPHLFDDSYTRWGPITWMPPETFLTLGDHLTRRGWAPADIAAVLGANFLRVARQTW
ncbi:dipeptidase [Nocardia sp. NPDC057353]|uniref:dipeptidase n=1 Tax=Nocardia sp. NPDC057353 TaxID=3346104 RepID=UPI003624DC57